MVQTAEAIWYICHMDGFAVWMENQHIAVVAVLLLLQLLGSSKGDVLWSATLDDAAADSASKLLMVQDDAISLVAWTPG